MKWIKRKGKVDFWELEMNYPFFNIGIQLRYDGHFYHRYDEDFGKNFENAKLLMESKLRKMCKKIVENNYTFEELQKLPHIELEYRPFPENIKSGWYYCSKAKSYKWIKGRFLYDYGIANNIALRYEDEKTENEVKQHACIIIKRQAAKFLRES